ncbi:MAG: ferrochelatase [Chlamydiales bacterium]|nr:ferrochelatase [Chlamydiales bacterium]
MKNKIGVLLVNLGTPQSAAPKHVFRYLNEFLTDGRVIDVPWLWRQILVRGLIVPKRYKNSAATYSQVWTEEGSPLLIHGRSVCTKLQEELGDEFFVKLAMRYQKPSIPDALAEFEELRLTHLVILPLFPQYASATTGSVHQKVMEVVQKWHIIPSISFINNYAKDNGFLDAFAAIGSTHNPNDYDRVLFSFHGLPRKHLIKADKSSNCLTRTECCEKPCGKNADCYRAQCYGTAQGIASRLNLSAEKYGITFQSRLGKEPWTEPYTDETIVKLAKAGTKKLLVFAPAFTADCLETTYEIADEYAHLFKSHGGERLQLVESLNDHPMWIQALANLTQQYCPKQVKA